MDKRKREDLVGHPSDYGSRTLADEDDRQRTERGEIGRTADGEPLEDRGSVDDDRPPDT
jgi:hypothetical protein